MNTFKFLRIKYNRNNSRRIQVALHERPMENKLTVD